MRRLLLLLLLAFSISNLSGQLNMTELGVLDIPTIHETGLNDIWGYTDEAGNEYAIVGAQDGVSVVDVTDPTSPEEIFWVDGLNSIWRDIKTWGDYAYVTTEAMQGLMILDLSGLPGDTDIPVSFYEAPEGSEWLSAHNLYQKDGYVYIFGAGRGNGGVIILDVVTNPLFPTEVGEFDDWYVHDGYVQDDTGYFAHIYEGFFSVVDLTDKTSPVLLGTAITPTNFSHNIWASEDGNYVFTTDEVAGGYIGAFDVSDPSSIQYLDKIQSSPGNDIVPHNSHVRGNYLYTSYYTDGVVIHDISNPNNLIEVANYDTSPLDASTTEGCWGVYPFFESGNIIASDREEGLFVLSAEEHLGSYLIGNITEMGTGISLNNVEVTISGSDALDFSNVLGDYATGIEGEGITEVTYSKVLYFPQTVPISFANGETVEQDIVLEKIPEFSLIVKVIDAETLEPIEGASVLLEHTLISHDGITNADGEAEIPLYYQDNYQLFGGKWGYQTTCFTDTMITDEITEVTVMVDQGIYDDFTFDFGWNAAGTAARGHWEREIPVGVSGGSGLIQNPYNDIGFDCGGYAYLTGNGTTVSNTEEVNDGEVILVSPVFDLTDFDNPHVNYSSWFFNMHGADPDDTMEVYLLNGLGDIVLIEQLYNGGKPQSQWNPSSIAINPLITVTENMQLMLILSDYVETENVTEGGIDNFSVTDFSIVGIADELESTESSIHIYPNPFSSQVNIKGVDKGWVTILDITGRQIADLPVSNQIDLAELEPGTYFFVISDLNRNTLEVITQVKN